MGNDLLVWMDLEMTGLDPARERVIEIAALITDANLEIIEEGPDLVIRQPDSVLDQMDEWNTTHHGESGLIERVRQSDISEAEAEARVLAFVARHAGPRVAPLAGNSVHQDRRFLRRHLPALDAHLHYRIVDVSTVKELVRRWYPEIYAGVPAKRGSHRAMDDIRESVAELAYYRAHAFRA